MPTKLGEAAENLACIYLEKAGYQIVARNWRSTWCEIDVVATKHDVLHIIEVKHRTSSSAFGSVLETITFDKQRRLIRAATGWATIHRHRGDVQIDVVLIQGSLRSNPSITLIDNAVTG